MATLAALIRHGEDNRTALLEHADVTAADLHTARTVLTRLLSAFRDQPT